VIVSRVVQTGLPEFGTLLAHIWLKRAPVDALEDLTKLFGSIDLGWSHPPGLNRRPADYEAENPPLSPSVLVGNRPVWPRLLVQFGGFWMGNWMGRTMVKSPDDVQY